jgi:hypothetical protein
MLKAAGARLWYPPLYSPDLNSIKQAFAKIKHWMRSAQKRTIEGTWRHIGSLLATIPPLANATTTSPTPDALPSKYETLELVFDGNHLALGARASAVAHWVTRT